MTGLLVESAEEALFHPAQKVSILSLLSSILSYSLFGAHGPLAQCAFRFLTSTIWLPTGDALFLASRHEKCVGAFINVFTNPRVSSEMPRIQFFLKKLPLSLILSDSNLKFTRRSQKICLPLRNKFLLAFISCRDACFINTL